MYMTFIKIDVAQAPTVDFTDTTTVDKNTYKSKSNFKQNGIGKSSFENKNSASYFYKK